jgi:hypothetical protein
MKKRGNASLFVSPSKRLPTFGGGVNFGFGSGFLGELSISRATPVYPIPISSFSVSVIFPSGAVAAYSTSVLSTIPDVVSYGGLQQPLVFVNTTDDDAYTSLSWSVRHLETGTVLAPGAGQTYTIIPNPTNMSVLFMTWEITLRAMKNGVSGVSYLVLRDHRTNTNDYALLNNSAIFRWSIQDQSPMFPVTTLSKSYVTQNDTWTFQVDNDARLDPDFISITEMHTNTGPATFMMTIIPTGWQFVWDFAVADFPPITDFYIQTIALFSSGPSPVHRFLHYKFEIPESRDLVSSLTWNGVATTFATQQPPVAYSTTTKITTLTFMNSTAIRPSWDSSLLTVTVT